MSSRRPSTGSVAASPTTPMAGVEVSASDDASAGRRRTSTLSARRTRAAAGVDQLSEALGANRLTPIQIVLDTNEPGGAFRPEFLEAMAELQNALAADDRVSLAIPPPQQPRCPQARGSPDGRRRWQWTRRGRLATSGPKKQSTWNS